MIQNRMGLLIALEGIDGTGKSTQLRLLAEELSRRGYAIVATREPTSGHYGQKIRALYSNRRHVSPEEEMALFMADRQEHVREVIGPALAAGKVVLTDRYYFSTAAYQGACGRDPESILKENEAFAPLPDLVILIELPPAVGIERIKSMRGEKPNDFEQEDFLRRVAAIFAALDRPCLCRLDGMQPAGEIHRQILTRVLRLLQRKGLQPAGEKDEAERRQADLS